MMTEDFKQLIKSAIINGEITDKKRQFLANKAEQLGIDADEFEIVLESYLSSAKKSTLGATKQTQKIGSVRRCPNCGAIISYESKCPECGYILNSMEANASIETLFETLNQLNSRDVIKKRQVLENFPIPNSKSDILEFLVAFKSKLSNPDDKFISAYLAKYTECVEKAKVYFPNDPDFYPFIQSLPEIRKGLKKGSTKRWIKNHKVLTGIIIYFAISILFSIGATVFFADDFFPDKSSEKEVRAMIANGDYDGARQFVKGIKSDYSRKELLDDITVAEVESLIENGSYEEARTKTLNINSDYKRKETIDDIIQKEVATLVMNNQLEEALQAASAINNEYTRGNTSDDIKSKLIDKYIGEGDLMKAEQMARTMYNEYTRNKYIDRINKLQ